jgi:hypothetical protein
MKNNLIHLCFLLLLLSCMIKYISKISARIQNQIIYGTKLMANSVIKLSRKKYNIEIIIMDVRNKNNIFIF